MTRASPTEREFNEELRKRLVELRKDKRWTQTEMADYLKCPYPAYTKYESQNDNRAFPIYLLPRLCSLTQARIEWVVTGKGPKYLQLISQRRDVA